MREGRLISGHHNQNHVVPVTPAMAEPLGRAVGTPVTVRVRRAEALPVVIRTWQNEEEILDAIKGALPHVPRCLAKGTASRSTVMWRAYRSPASARTANRSTPCS
ncbi:hypothetical protein ACR6C2_22060 [Streptomyces sp. INA 01156]